MCFFMKREHAEDILREAAEKLKTTYARPPKTRGNQRLVEDEQSRLAVYVSDVEYGGMTGDGRVVSTGEWAVIDFQTGTDAPNPDTFAVKYMSATESGTQRSEFDAGNTRPTQLVRRVREYLSDAD